MPSRLLDRQSRLLQYLTSSEAIFCDQGNAPLDPALHGLDREMLRLEARFSCEKRIEKICGIFPRTFAALGKNKATVVHEFVAACPPVEIGRLANAIQFHNFLAHRRERINPPYLVDILACELACAKIRMVEDRAREPRKSRPKPPCGHIRRPPSTTLLRCAHDVRPIFESEVKGALPEERETLLAVTMGASANEPRVLEVPPAVFDLLSGLDDWTDFQAGGTSGMNELIDQLLAYGLIEVAK